MRTLDEYIADGTPVPGVPYQVIINVPVSLIERHPEAQRETRLKHWRNRVLDGDDDNFDPARVGLLQGCRNGDERIYLTDGGHRAEYVRKYISPRAKVLVQLDTRQKASETSIAADAFIKSNTRVAVSDQLLYEMKLKRGDEDALFTAAQIARLGAGKFRPHVALFRVIQQYGREAQEWVINQVLRLWPDEAVHVTGVAIKALAIYYDKYGATAPKKRKRYESVGALGVEAKARKYGTKHNGRGSLAAHAAEILAGNYR